MTNILPCAIINPMSEDIAVIDPPKVLKNGAVYHNGRIVKGANTAQASTLARTRWDKAAAASRAALRDAVNDSGVITARADRTSVQAWGVIVGRAAEVLLNTDNARGFADLARFVGHATGYLPTAKEETAPAPVAPVQVGRILLLAAELLNGDREAGG